MSVSCPISIEYNDSLLRRYGDVIVYNTLLPRKAWVKNAIKSLGFIPM